MSALSHVLRQATGNRLHFWCPGCNGAHGIQFGEGPGPRWTWNGSVDKPTFQPSILVRRQFGEAMVEQVCHSFVTDGQIQFLGDCTHPLAEQTIPIPEWPHNHGDGE